MPMSLQADFQGTAASFRNSLSNMPLLILAALVTVISCSEFCMRASSIRLRFFPLCFCGVGAFLSLILFIRT